MELQLCCLHYTYHQDEPSGASHAKMCRKQTFYGERKRGINAWTWWREELFAFLLLFSLDPPPAPPPAPPSTAATAPPTSAAPAI